MQVSLPCGAARLLPFVGKSAVSGSLDLFFEVVASPAGTGLAASTMQLSGTLLGGCVALP